MAATGRQMSFENKEGYFLLRENGVRNGLSRTLVTGQRQNEKEKDRQ